MVELRFETDVGASADDVFSLLADLRGYDPWLPRSSAFHGTSTISDGPIGVGTTYVEPGPLHKPFVQGTVHLFGYAVKT